MAMHYLYILFSETANRFYIGETHDIQQRLVRHNNHSYTGSFTKAANNWSIILSYECKNREQAVVLEKFIKKMKSKVFIRKLITDNSILDDIVLNNNF